MLNRRQFTGSLAAATVAASTKLAWPFGSNPSGASAPSSLLELQQKFLDLRFGMYIHLNMASFEQREWGDPHASPRLFNPSRLDTDQWARAALSADMTYGCLTTKHHDGFCLWPTATASPSVRDSSFPHDIVASYAESFRRHGLKVCLYYSILDLRASIRPYAITRVKVDMIKAQLTELFSNYGEITALIIDGWNAGWSRISYNELPFAEIYNHVKRLQPNCLISDYNQGSYPAPLLYYTDVKQYEQHAGQTIPAGSIVPSQSATTLQSDWFWKKEYPAQQMRSANQIVNEWLIPFNQRHCNLILNVAPNTDGQFDPNALARLAEIGKLWKHPGPAPRLQPSLNITTPNLAARHASYCSSMADASGPDLANDDRPGTFWIADDGQTSGWLEIDLQAPTRFNTVAIIEPTYIDYYGAESRIQSYRVEAQHNGQWFDVLGHEATAPQIHRVQETVAERIRLKIAGRDKSPAIAEFGIYAEPLRS